MILRLLRTLKDYPHVYVYAFGMSLMAMVLVYPGIVANSYYHNAWGGGGQSAFSLPVTYMHRLFNLKQYTQVQFGCAIGGPTLSLFAVWWGRRMRRRRIDPILVLPYRPEMTPAEAPIAPPAQDMTKTGHQFPLQVSDEFISRRRRQAELREKHLIDHPGTDASVH